MKVAKESYEKAVEILDCCEKPFKKTKSTRKLGLSVVTTSSELSWFIRSMKYLSFYAGMFSKNLFRKNRAFARKK